MLALRTVVCADRWDEAWPQISTRLRADARARRRKLRADRRATRAAAQAAAQPLTPPPSEASPATTLDEARAAVEDRSDRALLVGMAATRRPWPELVRQLRADPAPRGLYVLAFGPHKNLELRAQALEAGVDRVVANSAFTRLLPTLLATPAAPVPDQDE